MRNKLFLLVLPALMALSGCSGVSASPKANLMAEDNLAHEEIFGAAVEAGELGLKKAAPRKLAELTSDFVKVGYQIAYKTADDTLSIRFVAAVKDAGVTAFWHRGLAQPNGYEGANVEGSRWKFKFEEYTTDVSGKESTKLYASLTDGTNTLTAGPSGTSGWTDYAGFAIYTVTGIPYDTYKDSYFAAYVNLADASDGNNKIKSQAIAVKIERDSTASKNRFFFDPTVKGHFLEGKINNVVRDGSDNSTHALVRAVEHDSGDNVASYSGLDMLTTDYFGSFYFDPNEHHFQYFGYNGFVKDTADIFFGAASLSGFNSPKFDGNFSVMVSRGSLNKIYGATTKTVTIAFSVSVDAKDGAGIFIAGDMTNWKANESYRLTWHAGNVWSGSFTIAIGTRLKYMRGKYDATAEWNWESGDGHYVTHETTSISCGSWESSW